MKYVGRNIVQSDRKLESISKILQNLQNGSYRVSKIFSWTFFDWVDVNNFQVVTQKYGILDVPIDMSSREYTKKSREMPWNLHFSHPSLGKPSGVMVIPIGMGIVDNEQNFIGILSGGLEIITLSLILEEKIIKGASFLILDNNLVPVSYSQDININEFLSKSEGNIDSLEQISNKFFSFYSYKKLQDYPYIVIIGQKQNMVLNNYIFAMIPQLLIIISMTIFALVIVHITSKKVNNLIEVSNIAEQELFDDIQHGTNLYISKILQQADLIIRFLEGKIQIGFTVENQIEVMKDIVNSALKLSKLNVSQGSLTKVNVNDLIHEAIKINYKKALIKEIIISTQLEENLPLISANLVTMKQIINSLLNLAINTNPRGGVVYINSTFLIENDSSKIVLSIKDNGFLVSRQDFERIQAIYGNKKDKDERTNLSLDNIIEMIKANNGEYYMDYKLGEGRNTKIIFFLNDDNKDINSQNFNKKS